MASSDPDRPAHGENREADEINVTPEVIEAGKLAYASHDPHFDAEVRLALRDVYLVMHAART
jgi:hypothetical protein